MLPIYECLDYLLNHLHTNRFKPLDQRIPFDVDNVVLPTLRLQNHEEFKGLMDMLIEDKYVLILEEWRNDLFEYTNRTMITPKGIDFIGKGGYTQKNINAAAENTRLENIENEQRASQRWMIWLTVVLTVGTIFPAMLAGADLYWKYDWFHVPFWWGMAILNVSLSVLTTILVWQWLRRSKLKKSQ